VLLFQLSIKKLSIVGFYVQNDAEGHMLPDCCSQVDRYFVVLRQSDLDFVYHSSPIVLINEVDSEGRADMSGNFWLGCFLNTFTTCLPLFALTLS
jgi:hypothetical protein